MTTVTSLQCYAQVVDCDEARHELFTVDVSDDSVYSKQLLVIRNLVKGNRSDMIKCICDVWNSELCIAAQDSKLDEFEIKFGCISLGQTAHVIHVVVAQALSKMIIKLKYKFLVEEGRTFEELRIAETNKTLTYLKNKSYSVQLPHLLSFIRTAGVTISTFQFPQEIIKYEVECYYHYTKTHILTFFHSKFRFEDLSFKDIREMIEDEVDFPFLFVRFYSETNEDSPVSSEQNRLK